MNKFFHIGNRPKFIKSKMSESENVSNFELEITELSPLNASTLKLIGIYLVLVFILCFSFNFMILRLFLKNKDLRNVFNVFIIAVSSLNLVGSIVFPFTIHSSFNNKYKNCLIFVLTLSY